MYFYELGRCGFVHILRIMSKWPNSLCGIDMCVFSHSQNAPESFEYPARIIVKAAMFMPGR
jgi:hypothetical protein